MADISYNKSVFINCPVDEGYRPLFQAAVFTVFRCDFHARCSEEERDSGEFRLGKIYRIIDECKFGIHDLSFARLDRKTGLPRFNMPFELGLFLGAKHFGAGRHDDKNCLVFEKKAYSYHKYISDIKGQDIESHMNRPDLLVRKIRDWLAASSSRRNIPGGSALWREYRRFLKWLPKRCRMKSLKINELIYSDYANLVHDWIGYFPRIGE